MAIIGGGLLWLGWSGFNGGDPYFANADAGAAVLNTHLTTATALLTWMFLDVFVFGKANVPGMINGMIAGLVAITPAAGFVNGFGALAIGLAAGVVPWLTMNRLGRTALLRRVDDTLGVLHTHAVPGALAGLMVGLLASPAMIVYPGSEQTAAVSVSGLVFGNPRQLAVQALALAVIAIYNAVATFILLKFVGLLVPLRMPETQLRVGDEAVHGGIALDLLPVGAET